MAESIRLFRGAFGHVSILHVAGDLVTHAHAEAHIIVWLGGAAGEMTIGRESIRLGPALAAGINAFEPHSHALSRMGRRAFSSPSISIPAGYAVATVCRLPVRSLPGRRSGSSRGFIRPPPRCRTASMAAIRSGTSCATRSRASSTA